MKGIHEYLSHTPGLDTQFLSRERRIILLEIADVVRNVRSPTFRYRGVGLNQAHSVCLPDAETITEFLRSITPLD